jgi:anti-sigma B factor antagonist
MTIEAAVEHPQSNLAVVRLKGRMVYSEELQNIKPNLAALAGQPGSVLVLDLSKVEYADSSGIGVLLYLDGIANEAGSVMRVAGASRRVLEVLHITRTDKILRMDPDVATSLSRGAT